ncbi:Hsp20/alpha crystallin family protein [Pseudodesulfovibrio piezophilus]|uniref:Heat shock protein HSP20 n=1 Tax=Pseudodesulfovibrio piezophilus (strain DSM 21447 / JCM 15486 / C1TLV30) TaxID=1322246 RepID=M1WNK1_PSEP2|nr:Hsp20/alpha crystallin family protein [Pseudodesulfovibrio piezophilus]CCH47639.1 Heat shock protein HSP20 [Pseudodesulfovibrio piezophilus C1TLV30]
MANLKWWSHNEISRMRQDMDKMFDELCTDFDLPVQFCRISGDLEFFEEEKTLVVRLELGTINPDDVDVSVLDRRLIISTKMIERSLGITQSETLKKEIKLPCVIQPEKVQASYSQGVLEVRLPKCPDQSGQHVTITKK